MRPGDERHVLADHRGAVSGELIHAADTAPGPPADEKRPDQRKHRREFFPAVFLEPMVVATRDGRRQNAPNTINIMKTKAAPMTNRSRRSVRLITPSCVIDLTQG
jgi:hypothetical protein